MPPVVAARPCALDRPRFRRAVRRDREEPLWRAAQHGQLAEAQQRSVRHWARRSERPVCGPWLKVRLDLDHVGQAHLVGLASPDPALALDDLVQVYRARVTQAAGAGGTQRRGERSGRSAQGGQAALGPVKPRRRLPFPAGLGESQQVDPATLVIEPDRAVGEDHRGVRVPGAVCVDSACLSLELVAEVAHPAERETERQRRNIGPVRLKVPP